MAAEIKTQPRLYAVSDMPQFSNPERQAEVVARVARLKKLQDRISKRPGIYLGALADIPDDVVNSDREIHDPTYATSDVSRTPTAYLTEYFQKRDVLGLELDPESDAAIFESRVSEREIMEQYIGRVASWNTLQAEKRAQPQAG